MKNIYLKNTRINISFLMLIFFIVSYSTLFAQKVDLDREYVKVEYIKLPTNPIKDKPLTYSFISNDPEAENQVEILGLERLNDNASLNISLVFKPVNIYEVKIKEIINEKKNDDGKVISRTKTFQPIVNYRTNAEFSYTDPNTGKNSGWNFGNTQTFKGKEYNTNKKASDYYKLNKDILRNQFELEFLNYSIGRANKFLNSNFGYETYWVKELFWILDSESNPEYTGHKKALKDIQTLFSKITPDANTEQLKPEAQSIIDYFDSVIPKFPKDKRKHRKMKYASYYNAAKILIHLDMPEKAIEYSNKLIENDYDESDGKRIIKRGNRLLELFTINNTKTRHFATETIDSRTFEEPKEPEVILVKEVIAKKPKNKLDLTGNNEIDNKIVEHLLNDLQLIKTIRARKIFPFKGNYLKKNGKIYGKTLHLYHGDSRYDTINVLYFNNKVIGSKIQGTESELIFSDKNLLKQINEKYIGSDKTASSYHIIRDNKANIIEVRKYYEGNTSRLSEVTKINYNDNKLESLSIDLLRKSDDKIILKSILNTPTKHQSNKIYQNRKIKEDIEFFSAEITNPSTVKFESKTTFKEKYKKTPSKYSKLKMYSTFGKVLKSEENSLYYHHKTGVESKFNHQYINEYQNKKLIKSITIVNDINNPKLSFKRITNQIDLPKKNSSSKEFEWRKGSYKFDSNNELIHVRRDGKYKEKINGQWSGWKFVRY